MFFNNIVFVVSVFAYALLGTVLTQNQNESKDAIGFPESEENPNLKNKDNRKPVFLPAKCPVNELYYPGDQKDDWICDCRPAYLFHLQSDACWPAYRKGPCTEGQYLVLPNNTVISTCEKNPCHVDGYVLWNGKCERMGATVPCNHLFPAAAAIGVNATTLAVDCVKLKFESRFGEETVISCPLGTKRVINGICTP